MSPSIRSGAELACDVLQQLGVAHVFGLPGTQNVSIYEALRRSTLRTVVATHELSATMMANGYYRSSGRLAALVTIPGPGFTWALTGLAEASLDSAALLHLVGEPPRAPGTCFQLQAIDQPAIARPLVKAVHRIGRFDEIGPVLAAAHAQALAGEPGPVLVQIARVALEARAVAPSFPTAAADTPVTDAVALEPVIRAVAAARRCVILAGQGCHGAADLLVRLAERLSAAVVTTTSGRGAVAEDHPMSLGFELAGTGAGTLNALIATSDLVLAIGCKFSHNGSRGFGLHLQADKLIHIDAAPEVLHQRLHGGRGGEGLPEAQGEDRAGFLKDLGGHPLVRRKGRRAVRAPRRPKLAGHGRRVIAYSQPARRLPPRCPFTGPALSISLPAAPAGAARDLVKVPVP